MNKLKNPPNDFTGFWVYECQFGNFYETEYVNGIKHGVYRHKYQSGVVFREGVMCKGLDHGLVTIRNSLGKKIDSYHFEHGTGTHIIYTAQDTIGWEIPYKNGKQHGTKRRYNNSIVVSEEDYCNGKRI